MLLWNAIRVRVAECLQNNHGQRYRTLLVGYLGMHLASRWRVGIASNGGFTWDCC